MLYLINKTYCLLLLVLAQDEVDKKGLSQKEVADNNQGEFISVALCC